MTQKQRATLELPDELHIVRGKLTAAVEDVAVPATWDEDQTYVEAEQPAAIGWALISAVHQPLTNASIAYLYRRKMQAKGIPRVSKATAASPLVRHLTEFDFVLEFNWELWRGLQPRTRIAWVDHELAHCGRDDETEVPTILLHDVEDFIPVVRRWGAYNTGMSQLVRTLEQLDLFGISPADEQAEAEAVQRLEALGAES